MAKQKINPWASLTPAEREARVQKMVAARKRNAAERRKLPAVPHDGPAPGACTIELPLGFGAPGAQPRDRIELLAALIVAVSRAL